MKIKKQLLRSTNAAKMAFIGAGLVSTLWFLVRVIPKPSRVAYPCMRTAAPLMSAFILYLIGISTSLFAFRKALARLRAFRYISFISFFMMAIAASLIALVTGEPGIRANASVFHTTEALGEGKGIYPGRVVWEWNPDATNENCTNAFGDAWDLAQNTNLQVVDTMVRSVITQLTGVTDITLAWDSLFVYFNNQHGKPAISYSEGEKIFIKTNFVGGHRVRLNNDHSRKDHPAYGNSQTSPQVILVVLSQLIDSCGVSQENIFVGDPSKNIYKHTWDMLHEAYPGVHYVAELDEMGREQAVPGDSMALIYSDHGTVLGKSGDFLCRQLEDADYLINIAALKGHERAGITLCAKNHFGSHMSDDASHLHPGLVQESGGYGKYRVLVDLMAHEKLGGNTMLYLVDGLWAGPDANLPPGKWKMSPFHNDWTSSVLASLDPVALESVCYDFLRTEYRIGGGGWMYPFPQMEGTDDYLIQAADSTYWPEGLTYDPEGDGTSIGSLGTYEHWNNDTDKRYSRDLGHQTGIELIKPALLDHMTSTDRGADKNVHTDAGKLLQVFPNPASNEISLRLDDAFTGTVTLAVYRLSGQLVSSSVAEKHSRVWIHRVDLTDLSPGEYLLVVSNHETRWARRIIKK